MDIKQIKQIIDLVTKAELTEFALEEEGFKLKLQRRESAGTPSNISYQAIQPTAPSLVAQTPSPTPVIPQAESGAPVDQAAREEAGIVYVKSPMVGSFYRASSPDSQAFASVGMKVEADTVVCIIEAMKIMNEIQAEVKGTIVEVLIENGQPVEYGQKLFKIKQS